MSTITIVLTDLPEGRGIALQAYTNRSFAAEKSPTEDLAIDLMRICRARVSAVRYDTHDLLTTEAMQLLKDLLHPEELGHAVTAEVRDRARICLGLLPVESHLTART